MPTIRQSVQIAQRLPALSANGNSAIHIPGEFTVPVGLAATDVIEMGVLPAGYVPVEVLVQSEDLDSNGTPTITLDFGILTGAPYSLDTGRTCGNEGFTGSVVGQAGGVQFENKAALGMLAPSNVDRGFGLRVAAGAATLVVGAKVRATLVARPSLNGI